MGKALAIIYRVISGYLVKQAGLSKTTAQTGSVTFIQRFGSALKYQGVRYCLKNQA